MFSDENYLGSNLYGTSQLSLSDYNVDSLLVNNERETNDYVNKNDYIRINQVQNRQDPSEFEGGLGDSEEKYEMTSVSNLSKHGIINNNIGGIHDMKLFSPFSTSSRSECSTNCTFQSPSFKEKDMKSTLKNNNMSFFQTRYSKMSAFTKDELKILSKSLPHTKIKRILKLSGLLNNLIGSEVPALLAIACELFVRDLTDHAWSFTKLSKRRILQVQDIKLGLTKDLRIKNLLEKSELKNEFIFDDSSFKNYNNYKEEKTINKISPIFKTVTQSVESENQDNFNCNLSFSAENEFKHNYNQSINYNYKNDSSQQYLPSYRRNINQNYDITQIYIDSSFPN